MHKYHFTNVTRMTCLMSRYRYIHLFQRMHISPLFITLSFLYFVLQKPRHFTSLRLNWVSPGGPAGIASMGQNGTFFSFTAITPKILALHLQYVSMLYSL